MLQLSENTTAICLGDKHFLQIVGDSPFYIEKYQPSRNVSFLLNVDFVVNGVKRNGNISQTLFNSFESRDSNAVKEAKISHEVTFKIECNEDIMNAIAELMKLRK